MLGYLRRPVAALLLLAVSVWPALASTATAPTQSLVPLRVVAEATGARVDWDNATWTVTITTREGVVVTVRIGDVAATVNGQPVPVGRAVELVNGRTMIAPAFLQSVLGIPVRYDPETDTALVDPRVETALAFVRSLPAGTGPSFHDHLTPALQGVLTKEILQAVAVSFTPYGELARAAVAGVTTNAVHTSVEVIAQFERVALQMVVRFAPDGKIDDFLMAPYLLVPPAGSPPYADPNRFTEEEVIVGEEPWRLPGTLSLPVGDGPFPVVVLVHGSGPNDRDESVGGVKPFRDLAHGLASQGIAVLRFEKRTREHSQKFAVTPRFTLQQESIDDALAAVGLVSGDARLDPQQVFVLGHSMGGIALPRILQQDTEGQIRGGIIMAGTNNFYEALLQQNKYVVQNGEAPPQQLAFIEGQIAMLTDPSFDPAQPPQGYALGTPYYWHDLVPKSADLLKGQTQPVLILQGQRDFQVPANQLDSFQADLAERQNVTYKLYPKLNHLFTEGEGEISSMKEYMVQANIPFYVIEDITAWVKAQK